MLIIIKNYQFLFCLNFISINILLVNNGLLKFQFVMVNKSFLISDIKDRLMVKISPVSILFLLFVGVFMGALDMGIVGPALPAIQEYFGMNDRILSWIFTIYILSHQSDLSISMFLHHFHLFLSASSIHSHQNSRIKQTFSFSYDLIRKLI